MAAYDLIRRATEYSKWVMKCVRAARWTIESDVVRKQLVRSATSIGANLIEAQYAISHKEFIRYNQIAFRSAKESEYWLELMNSLGDIPSLQLIEIREENAALSRILSAILRNAKKNTLTE